jgi:hypothetical protein
MKPVEQIYRGLIDATKKAKTQTFLGVLLVIVVFLAIWLTCRAMDYVDNQLSSSSRLSDSLFSAQLKYSKALNDSLLNEIGELQKVTRMQLHITDMQLQTARESLNERLFADRPKLTLVSIKLDDSSTTAATFSPEVSITLRNTGERTATKVSMRPFVMFTDFSGHRQGVYPEPTQDVEPERDVVKHFSPKMPSKHRADFYFYFELSYYDVALKRTYVQTQFYRYGTIGDKSDFRTCGSDEKKMLLERTNEILVKGKKRLLSRE